MNLNMQKIAQKLSCSHNTFNIDDYYLKDLIEKIPYHYDEPFGDSSQIPSLIIAKELKVTVALTGDGGMRYLEDILDIYGEKKFQNYVNIHHSISERFYQK